MIVVRMIDYSFLLNANSLDNESKKEIYPVLLIDGRLKEPVYVMVKGVKITPENKYKVII